MRALWYFIHMFGYSLWIGGAIAAMAIGIAARKEGPETLGTATRMQGVIHRMAIGPGALASLVSGLILTMQMYNQATAVGLGHWLMAMQGLGLIATLLVFVVALPTSAKLSRLEPTGPTAPAFNALRARLVAVSMAAGTLAVLALLTGALHRYP